MKRYIAQNGTDAVLDWSHRATEIGLSAIAVPELISAFCWLQRENKVTSQQYQQLRMSLLTDIEDIAIGDLTPIVLSNTVNSLENNVLRGQWMRYVLAVQWPWNAMSLSLQTYAS